MVLFTLLLEARAPEKNLLRSYHIAAGQNLFGDWLVELTYGRIGSKGRTFSLLARDEDEAKKLIKHCLKRRQTARRRLGVTYQIIDTQGAWRLD